MKPRFILFKRAGIYYSEDTTTRKQYSLRTKDEAEALTILHSKNEAFRQPVLNLQIARTYLTAIAPEVAKRTWQTAMDELTKTKTGTPAVVWLALADRPPGQTHLNSSIYEQMRGFCHEIFGLFMALS